MANSVKLNGVSCVRMTSALRSHFAVRPDGARPNSFKSRWGVNPGVGWVLLLQRDVDAFDLDAINHVLTFTSDNGTVQIEKLAITTVESIYRVPHYDGDDLVLLRLEDVRCLGKFTFVDASWNAVRRSWMSDTSKRFATASRDIQFGKDIVVDLWGELPAAIFGAAPALDIGGSHNDVDYPEDLHYRKVNGWKAVAEVANKVGLQVTIERDGSGVLFAPHNLSAGGWSSELSTYNSFLLRSTRTQTPDSQDIPEKFKVLFRKAYTDTIANTDSNVVSAEEDHLFNSFLEVEVNSSLFTAATTIPGTVAILYHDRILVNRDASLATYTSLAENLVESRILSLTQDQEEQFYVFTGFKALTPQAWNTIEWVEDGGGPITISSVNRTFDRNNLSDYHDKHRTAFGFGQVTQVSTKFNRDTDAVSIDGRLKPVQRKTTDGLLDVSSQKEMEFASISDYPIRPCQNIFWMMDHNSSKPIAIPIGLQTNKPLFIRFQIVDPSGGQTDGCPNEEAHPSNNAYVIDQEWGPTLIGDGRYQRVETSVPGCGANTIILEKGCTGLAYLREDDVYEAISSSCCAGSGSQEDPDSGALIYETDIRCEQGKLAVYRKYVYIILTNGILSRRDTQGWVFSHYAGCCDCGSSVIDPPDTTCEGECYWQWDASGSLWTYLFDTCSESTPECGCNNTPTFSGLFDYDVVAVPCYTPPEPPPGGSGSGSGISGCTGNCAYMWVASASTWIYLGDDCVEDGGGGSIQCVCFPPTSPGSFDGAVVYVPCGDGGVGV